jgi:hypothetical protein
MEEIFAEVIHVYTRKQAIEDGVLVDVTEAAGEVGFVLPVAMTQAVWADCVAWDAKAQEKAYQDESGRLHDVVWMAFLAARQSSGTNRIKFGVYRIPREGRGVKPRLVELEGVCGPGDSGEPVVTLQFRGED